MKISRVFSGKNRGFTLVELLVVLAIMGFISSGILLAFTQGLDAWIKGSAKLSLYSEARIAVSGITKIIHNARGSSIVIKRFDPGQPLKSYLAGRLAETTYVETSSPGDCGFGSGTQTIGSSGDDFAIYQHGRFLIARIPYIASGDISDPSTVNISYNYVTISSKLDSLMFTYLDSQNENAISIGARFSVLPEGEDEPVEIFLKKNANIRHQASAGYYAN